MGEDRLMARRTKNTRLESDTADDFSTQEKKYSPKDFFVSFSG